MDKRRRAALNFGVAGGGGSLLKGRGKRCRERAGVRRGWGRRSAEGGCAGRAVKDRGVREGQHLDSERFPMQVRFV